MIPGPDIEERAERDGGDRSRPLDAIVWLASRRTTDRPAVVKGEGRQLVKGVGPIGVCHVELKDDSVDRKSRLQSMRGAIIR